MSNELSPRAPQAGARRAADAQRAGWPALAELARRWWAAAGERLARAEQRVTENFKVPPSGG